MTGQSAKKARDYSAYADDQGMDYLAGAAAPGVSIQHKVITQPGTAPLVVNFADEGMADMANADYTVIAQGETTARVTVDDDTRAVTGFNVLAGAQNEVIHLIVIGTVAGQLSE